MLNLSILVRICLIACLVAVVPGTHAAFRLDSTAGGISIIVDLLGQYGGITNAAVVNGTYAYVGVGPRLVVLDVSNPATPVVVGRSPVLPNIVQSLDLQGSLAYVTLGSAGLQMIDVSNPTSPELRGRFDSPGTGWCVSVAGSVAYLADGPAGLHLIDVSDPDDPMLLSTYSGLADDVTVVGARVYLARSTSMLILDVSNPTNIMLHGTYAAPGYVEHIAIADGLAYLASNIGGLVIVNVTQPASLVTVGSINPGDSSRYVQVVGTTAYLVTTGAQSSSIDVIDASLPAQPILQRSYSLDTLATMLTMDDTRAIIANGQNGLVILDVSGATPAALGSYDTPGRALRVQTVNDIAYVADEFDGLWIIDISDPTNPQPLSLYTTPQLTQGVTVVGNLAYVADGDSGMQIVDVTNPTSPTLVGAFDSAGYTSEVAIRDTLAYLADGGAFAVADVSNPAVPSQIGRLDSRNLYSIDVVGTKAYAANRQNLGIINIANPSSPTFITQFTLTGAGGQVKVQNNLAYIAIRGGSLEIVDVTDSMAPAQLSNLIIGGNPFGLDLINSRVYVAAGSDGLKVVDVSTPTAPHVLGSYPTAGAALGVDVVGQRAYVAADVGGFVLFDVSNGGITPTNTPTSTPTSTRTPTPTVTPQGNVRRLYAPWIGRQPTPTPTRICPQDPYEPNETFLQAWGPLPLNYTLLGYFNCTIDTDRDFYYFDLATPQRVIITLQNIPANSDYDLALYDCAEANCLVGFSGRHGSVDEEIDVTTGTGRNYVRVTRSPTSPLVLQPYHLRVSTP